MVNDAGWNVRYQNPSSQQHPQNRVGSNSTLQTSQPQQLSTHSNAMVTISPSSRGYQTTAAILPDATTVVTGSSIPNNASLIRSVPITSSGVAQVAVSVSSAANLNIPATVTICKNPISTSRNGLASATEASNKVIDLVELSDEEDADGPNRNPLQQQQIATSRSQQLYVTRPPIQSNQAPLPATYYKQPVANRNHVQMSNSPRSTGPAGVSNTGGLRPMVFANQMANGVNVQRVVQGIGSVNHSKAPPLSHPAPLPDMPNPQPHAPSWKKLPPRPTLKISRLKSGKQFYH